MMTADRRRTVLGIVTYVVLTVALSAIIWRVLISARSLSAGGEVLVLVLMWCPGVAGLVTRLLYYRTLRGVGWRWGAWRYAWAGYWIPIVYASVVYLPLWAAGYANFHAPALASASARLHIAGWPPPLIFVAYALVAGTTGMIPNSLAALGEELGWRGFLVPELAKVTSFTKVSLISGAIWGAWHMPLIIGADYHGAGPVWYSVLCFTVGVVALGFLFAWLRLRSGSVWPCMLLHASHNLFVQAIFDPMTRHAPLTDLLIGEFGAGLAIVLVVVAYIVWRKDRTDGPPSAPLLA